MASQTTRQRAEPGSRAEKVTLMAAVIALFNKASFNNVFAATAVGIGAPAAATAFVYEISDLRGAQLQREAADRKEFLRVATGAPPALAAGDAASALGAAPQPDLGGKLDGMIASRAKMLDLFGDEPSTVAPVYARIIRQMLSDDTTALASLDPREETDLEALVAKQERLRAIHARLAHLVGA